MKKCHLFSLDVNGIVGSYAEALIYFQ